MKKVKYLILHLEQLVHTGLTCHSRWALAFLHGQNHASRDKLTWQNTHIPYKQLFLVVDTPWHNSCTWKQWGMRPWAWNVAWAFLGKLLGITSDDSKACVSQNWCHTLPASIAGKQQVCESQFVYLFMVKIYLHMCPPFSLIRAAYSPACRTLGCPASPRCSWTRQFGRSWLECPWKLLVPLCSSLNDRPQIFDRWPFFGAVARRLVPPPEFREVRPAPLPRLAGSMCWGAVLLKNGPRHVWEELNFTPRPFLLLPHHRKCCQVPDPREALRAGPDEISLVPRHRRRYGDRGM